MTCKSHALLLVFAAVALAPASAHIWSSFGLSAAHASVAHDAALAGATHHVYRCGIGPLINFVVSSMLAMFGFLVAYAVSVNVRDWRFLRSSPVEVLPSIAGAVVTRMIRIHYTAALLGYAAMAVAWGADSFRCSVALAVLATVVASRGSTCSVARTWLAGGASVVRRGHAVVVAAGGETTIVRAAGWVFRAAERAVVPTAIAAPR